MNNKKYQQAFQREVHSHHSECARMDRESLYTALEPSRVTVSMTVNLIETCRCSWETLLLPSESQFCWLTKRLHPRKLTWNPKWWFGKGDSFWIWPFLIFLFDVRGVPNNSPMPIIQQSSHWDPGGGEKKNETPRPLPRLRWNKCFSQATRITSDCEITELRVFPSYVPHPMPLELWKKKFISLEHLAKLNKNSSAGHYAGWLL